MDGIAYIYSVHERQRDYRAFLLPLHIELALARPQLMQAFYFQTQMIVGDGKFHHSQFVVKMRHLLAAVNGDKSVVNTQ